MNKTLMAGAGLWLTLLGGAALAQSGGTSQTEDEQNMTAGAATHGTTTPLQEKLQDAYMDFNNNRFPEATGKLHDILRKAPDSLMAHQMLAAIYQKQNDVHDLVPELEAIIRLNPTDAYAPSNLGVAYLQNGDFEKAAAQFGKLQGRKPTALNAYYLGLAQAGAGKKDDAVASLQNAIKLGASAPEYFELGVVEEQSGKHAEAAAAFESASGLNAKDANAPLDAGLLYHQIGQDAKAVPLLQKALALKPDDPFDAHMALAEIDSGKGDNDGAILNFKQAAKDRPDDFGAQTDLGVLSQNIGKNGDAIAAYRAALKLKAPTPEAAAQVQSSLAHLLAQDGTPADTDEAVGLLTQAAQADPKNASYVADLGQVYENQGKKDLALAAYKQALTLDAAQPEAKAGAARLTK